MGQPTGEPAVPLPQLPLCDGHLSRSEAEGGVSAPTYTRDRLAAAAAESSSMVDLMRRLGATLGSGSRGYLNRRLRHYGIDTSHFREEPLPERERRSYSKDLLAKAAAHSHSIREVLEYMDLPPRDNPYGHIRKKLDQYGIDTSHFTRGRRYGAGILARDDLVAAVEASFSLARHAQASRSCRQRRRSCSREAEHRSARHFNRTLHRARPLPRVLFSQP